MAVECYSLEADVYKFLNQQDSVIIVSENASTLFREIHRYDRASQMASLRITPLIKKGKYADAKRCIEEYETYSGLFNTNGDIIKGREIYYYIKGEYYLAINQVDSAELLFRKELGNGKDLNNQIAACKGLQEVYEKKKMPDSIAKYSKFCYELNDSAYSLSEMQNIQKLQASYDYNHLRYKVEKKDLEAERAWLIVALVSIIFIILGLYFGQKYFGLRKIALDYRLRKADITHHLKKLANSNPPQYPTLDDWDKLRALVEHEIPTFHKILKVDELSLTELEYDICLMIRVHLLPIEISKLKQCSPSHISNIRKRLLLRIFGIEGGSEDFDDEIGKIE
jgi:tetratricopeptide (TPR) repeat protein